MGGCANIPRGVVQDEVFEMDQLAVDPQCGFYFVISKRKMSKADRA